MALDQSVHTERSQAGTHANIDWFSADHLPPTGKVFLISWSAWFRQAAVVCPGRPGGTVFSWSDSGARGENCYHGRKDRISLVNSPTIGLVGPELIQLCILHNVSKAIVSHPEFCDKWVPYGAITWQAAREQRRLEMERELCEKTGPWGLWGPRRWVCSKMGWQIFLRESDDQRSIW